MYIYIYIKIISSYDYDDHCILEILNGIEKGKITIPGHPSAMDLGWAAAHFLDHKIHSIYPLVN